MIVASFVAAQRTEHRVPHATCCGWLRVGESSFYKWQDRGPTLRQQRWVVAVGTEPIRLPRLAGVASIANPPGIRDNAESFVVIDQDIVDDDEALAGYIRRAVQHAVPSPSGRARWDPTATRAPSSISTAASEASRTCASWTPR